MTGFSKLVVYRNGVLINNNVTASPYTDPAVLDPNTTYVYKILAYDPSGVPGTPVYKTIVTLPTLTSLTVSSVTASQISLAFIGQYSYVNITRNGTYVATNITGTTFTDTGLSQNFSYIYIVTPYNSSGDPGTPLTITQLTLQTITSLSAIATSSTQIDLTYAGSYTNVSITRNGTAIATNITGTSFSDTGLTTNTSYIYVITPYNASNVAGSSATISKTTLPSLTSLSVSSFTASQIVLTYAGSYTDVSITRNGTAISIATNITGTTFTDTGLSANTSYTYVVAPNNSSGAGSTLSITNLTLGNITSVSASATSSTQIVLTYAGNYTNVSITRNGISIATNITGTTFSDTGLTAHTSYTYAVTPNNSAGSGSSSSITKGTLGNITSFTASATSSTQIVLTYAGSYTNVSITRNGTAIATNITGTTYTDTGLTVNTSYTYVITPNNTSGAGSTLSITKYTLGNITSLSVSSETTAQTVLVYSGNYTNVSITRNGTAIATNITGTSYTDTGLASNTSYTYVVTPFNVDGIAGATSSIINVTLPYIVSISVSSQTSSQIVLTYAGNYTNVSITRNGTAIATNVTGTSFTDTGLTTNTSYTYILIPYNSDGEAGDSSTITHGTLGLLTSVSAISESTTQILLQFSGTYTNVSITRDGTAIATNITGTTFTDTGLTVNTSYTYILTPYNVNGIAGATSSITKFTLPNIVSFGLFSATASQIVLTFSGNYVSVNIARGGSTIASGVTTATYTDSPLSSNTSYTYVVTPVNSAGVGTASSGITVFTLPGAPTIGTATVSSTTAVSVAFTAPSGTGTITGYTVTSSPGGLTGTGTSSPITVSGLSSNTVYTFTATATTSAGTSVASSASTAVTTQPGVPTINSSFIVDSSSIGFDFTIPTGTGTLTGYTATRSPGGITSTATSSFLPLDSFNLVYSVPFGSTDPSGLNIACSSTGQYISICATGSIYVSSNFGNTFTLTTRLTDVYSIAMSSTGQYQATTSTGSNSGDINVSNNYGVTWTTPFTTNYNLGRWPSSVCMDSTGQFMFVGGGGSAGLNSYSSKNFGVTWTIVSGSAIANRQGSAINNYTRNVISTRNVRLYYVTDLSGTPTETLGAALPVGGAWRIATDGSNNLIYTNRDNTGYGYSSNFGATFTTGNTPVTFISIAYSSTTLWACSNTTIYYSTNNGTSWTSLPTQPKIIRSMTVSTDNNCLYVVYTDGSIHLRRTNHLSFVFSGLTADTAYTFSVVATNSSGTSAASNTSSSLTPTKFTSFAPASYSDVSGVSTDGAYRIYTFTGSSTYTIPYTCSNPQQMYILVVGGGGSGGVSQGGGGGGGGFYQTIKTIPTGSSTITINVGAQTTGTTAVSGNNTTVVFNADSTSITAYGGGSGAGSGGITATQGGSGGGASGSVAQSVGTTQSAAAISAGNLGNSGGTSTLGTNSAGGGGSWLAGRSSVATATPVPGLGGSGLFCNLKGIKNFGSYGTYYWCGGGGGSTTVAGGGGAGTGGSGADDGFTTGAGEGGKKALNLGTAGSSGVGGNGGANTGGGGGGGLLTTGSSGQGASGIVIIAVPT